MGYPIQIRREAKCKLQSFPVKDRLRISLLVQRMYEEIYPETRHGACGGGKNGVGIRGKTENVKNTSSVPPFVTATAKRLNCSESTVQKAVHRATPPQPTATRTRRGETIHPGGGHGR